MKSIINGNYLTWEELTDEQKEQAKESYLCIREEEEQRDRNETMPEYPDPIDWERVKDCKFEIDGDYVWVII